MEDGLLPGLEGGLLPGLEAGSEARPSDASEALETMRLSACPAAGCSGASASVAARPRGLLGPTELLLRGEPVILGIRSQLPRPALAFGCWRLDAADMLCALRSGLSGPLFLWASADEGRADAASGWIRAGGASLDAREGRALRPSRSPARQGTAAACSHVWL